MNKLLPAILSLMLWSMCCVATAHAHAANKSNMADFNTETKDSILLAGQEEPAAVLFRFAPKRKMFFIDYQGNKQAIQEAADMIEANRDAIERGDIYISVNGYCSSFQTEHSNRKMARSRSNQVKSYYITNYGLKEKHYRTTNHTTAYHGDKNVVAMMQLVQATKPSATADTDSIMTDSIPEIPRDTVAAEPVIPTKTTEPEDTVYTSGTATGTMPASTRKNAFSWSESRWSVKTNAPAWALVVPNLAVEYKFADNWSADLPVYYSPFTVSKTYRFRIFAVQPSVRYWLSTDMQGHFFGLHATGGMFNISTDSKTRYQDKNGMWGAGINYGYTFRFTEHWGLELNIGAGWIHTEYDKFYNIDNGAAFDTKVKNYWGITRCGISVIYKLK